MRKIHTLDVYRILRANGLSGATFGIEFDVSDTWVLPTKADIADLSHGAAHEHFKFRQDNNMVYDNNECNCHDFTQTFLHLVRMRHIRSMRGVKTGRILCGGVVYTPKYSFDFGSYNGRVMDGVNLSNSGRHEIVWFITDDDRKEGGEQVWFIEPQTDKLWPLQAGEIQTVERVYPL